MTYALLQLGIGDQAVAVKKKLLRPWEIFVNVTDVTSLLGVIQQLRGPNVDPILTPSPLEWTIVDILQTLCSHDQV